MSDSALVDYIVYKGERPHGTIVIRSEKGSSNLRTFSYSKGINYRVGVNIHPRQADFILKNHNDLFRLEKVEVHGMDLIYKDLEVVIPKFHEDVSLPACMTLRYTCEAVMALLNIKYDKGDSLSSFSTAIESLVEAYQGDLSKKELQDALSIAGSKNIDSSEDEEKSKPKKLLRRNKT